MIASARVRTYEDRFLEMLPQIQDQAHFAFRDKPASRRKDLIAEAIANGWVACVRLVERGLIDVIYPTPLVQFAIRQVRDGRRVGTSLNANDVSSEYAQRRLGFRLEALEKYNQRNEVYRRGLDRDPNHMCFGLASIRVAAPDAPRGVGRRESRQRSGRRVGSA